jgi:DNA-binding SARP family transcriptional activator
VAPIRVYGLGPARELRAGRLLGPADWTYQKPRELLHYLLGEAACGKAQVGLALWPEASPAALRNSFHTTVRHLRRALGDPAWVVFRDARYAFNRELPYDSDVEAFEAGLTAADAATATPDRIGALERALAHYRGDFLADLPAAGWIEARRLALRGRAEEALGALSRLLLAEGRPDRAAVACQRLLGFDELRESVHRQLMRCYTAMGERGAALRQYAALAGRLADELGVGPARETVALYDRLRAG